MMDIERVFLSGLLSKDAGFRLIVVGHVGAREIERLIKKLQFEQEILADVDDLPHHEEEI